MLHANGMSLKGLSVGFSVCLFITDQHILFGTTRELQWGGRVAQADFERLHSSDDIDFISTPLCTIRITYSRAWLSLCLRGDIEKTIIP